LTAARESPGERGPIHSTIMYDTRKILVIGSNSFSGSDFVDLLLDDSRNDVVGISRSAEKTALFLPYKQRTASRFRFMQLDLNTDMPRIVDLIHTWQPSHVVNFAAQSEVAPSWKHPDHWYRTNVVALAQLTQALVERQTSLHRYVHISSPEVYGSCEGTVTESASLNPSTPYAASKAAADLHLFTLVKNFDFPLIMIRSTNVYGAHQQLFKIIPRSVISLKMGKTIPLHGGGVAVKSYIHIRDVSRGELAAMEQGRPGTIYHLSPDQGYAVRDVVRAICDRMGRSFEESTVAVGERPGQDAAYVIDSTRARTELGWTSPISLDEGLRGVVEWIDGGWNEVRQHPLDYIHQP
jgi:dTDP-glucose 4,6-dehydratase